MRKKRPYSSPTLKPLTPEQAKKIIADRKNCTEEEAAEVLKSLQRQKQTDPKQNEPLEDNKDQEKKRSA